MPVGGKNLHQKCDGTRATADGVRTLICETVAPRPLPVNV